MRKCSSLIAAVLLCLSCTCAGEQAQEQVHQEKGVIRGVVLDERGRPVGGITVTAIPLGAPLAYVAPSAETSPDGSFSIGALRFGRYQICGEKAGAGYIDTCLDVTRAHKPPVATISAEAPSAGVLVVIGPRAGVLAGSVKDAVTGAALDAALVVRASSGAYTRQVLSSQFEVGLASDADLDLEVQARGYRVWRYSVDVDRKAKPFRVHSGEKRTIEIRLWPE